MKFYYNGKLIRSSEHAYTHAVINIETGMCEGCRTSEQAARSIISQAINRELAEITNCKSAIKALESGKKYYTVKIGRRTCPIKLDKDDSIKLYEDYMKASEKFIEAIKQYWRVVELEAK